MYVLYTYVHAIRTSSVIHIRYITFVLARKSCDQATIHLDLPALSSVKMLDVRLRPLKDEILLPVLPLIPSKTHPLHVTLVAFLAGLGSCYLASISSPLPAALFFLLNRFLDCLDGAVARHRSLQSDLGGFLDLLGDFVVYSLIPVSVASSSAASPSSKDGKDGKDGRNVWVSVAVLEAAFYLNNFVLFYAAAAMEKLKRRGRDEKQVTSMAMRPALVEGVESGFLFVTMLSFPSLVDVISWGMSLAVMIGTVQRVSWLVVLLGTEEKKKEKKKKKKKKADCATRRVRKPWLVWFDFLALGHHHIGGAGFDRVSNKRVSAICHLRHLLPRRRRN